MNIVMMTNTYIPIIGGLEKSVESFSQEYRKRGHNVLIVAPEFEGVPEKEEGVFRIPAIQNFNGTDFSVELPISPELSKTLKAFKPDIIHTHHPFLIGDTALRAASEFNVPIIFTHHTLYEKNTHYVPGDSKTVQRFVVQLARGYANLCDRVIAPSPSIAKLLKQRKVKTPVDVLPTGIYLDRFKKGNGEVFRQFFEIPAKAFVVGIVGRVAPEKNVQFLAKAAMRFLKMCDNAYFVVVGSGPSLESMRKDFEKRKLADRLVCTGVLKGNQLISAYKALDVFAFASHSETQGLVLNEAMAAGTPVVAVNAPGVRDVLRDQENGRMIARDNVKQFVMALQWMFQQSPQKIKQMKEEARCMAAEFSMDQCVQKALDIYQKVIDQELAEKNIHDNSWRKTLRILDTQKDLMINMTKATTKAVGEGPKRFIRKTTRKIQRKIKHMVL
ncbi:MAG: glycosyltransferase [Candidatus Omnitrophica bacterium]|nr:glycosyltransferase [Candidatus Omnitrophota bacterium]